MLRLFGNFLLLFLWRARKLSLNVRIKNASGTETKASRKLPHIPPHPLAPLSAFSPLAMDFNKVNITKWSISFVIVSGPHGAYAFPISACQTNIPSGTFFPDGMPFKIRKARKSTENITCAVDHFIKIYSSTECEDIIHNTFRIKVF